VPGPLTRVPFKRLQPSSSGYRGIILASEACMNPDPYVVSPPSTQNPQASENLVPGTGHGTMRSSASTKATKRSWLWPAVLILLVGIGAAWALTSDRDGSDIDGPQTPAAAPDGPDRAPPRTNR
jgi:hypothetical protein